MANNANQVSVGKPMAAGGVYAGDIATQAPTDATTPLSAAIKGLGYVSDDGLTNSLDMDTETVTAWGGDTVLTVATSRNETFTWTFIESLSVDVLREVYGQDNVTAEDENLVVIHNNSELPQRLYVFEILLTGGKVKRIVVPNGKITEIGDVQYVDGEPIGYEVTLSCSPDAAGNTVYEYIAEIAGGKSAMSAPVKGK